MSNEIRIRTRKIGNKSYLATNGSKTSQGKTKWLAVKRLIAMIGAELEIDVEFYDLENCQVEARKKGSEDGAKGIGINDWVAERMLRVYLVCRDNLIYVDGELYERPSSNITSIVSTVPRDVILERVGC